MGQHAAPLTLATWNVNSLRVRLPQVADWLAARRPDVLALQETKIPDEDFPASEFAQLGYRVLFSGQRTYNGVALLSLQEGRDVVRDLPGMIDPQRRVLAATVGGVRLVNFYVPNGAEVDSDKYAYKLEWLRSATDFLCDELTRHPRLAVMGDFNIAPEDRDVHDPVAWQGSVLVSPAERRVFADWLGLGLQDAFRLFAQPEASFSWWDYRGAGFRRNQGLRIDHILLSTELAARCRACAIDTAPRRHERPSDHAPVMIELAVSPEGMP